MNTIIAIIAVLAFCYLVYLIHSYFADTLEYKMARATEIKRRLQVEAKADAVWKDKFKQAESDIQRVNWELQASRERHERAMKYVLADIFERYV